MLWRRRSSLQHGAERDRGSERGFGSQAWKEGALCILVELQNPEDEKLYESNNFEVSVRGCIEAEFCRKILFFAVRVFSCKNRPREPAFQSFLKLGGSKRQCQRHVSELAVWAIASWMGKVVYAIDRFNLLRMRKIYLDEERSKLVSSDVLSV